MLLKFRNVHNGDYSGTKWTLFQILVIIIYNVMVFELEHNF